MHWQGDASWLWKYYTFRVTVYCPWTQRLETSEATDPYSVALAADGARSQFAVLEVRWMLCASALLEKSSRQAASLHSWA